MNIDGHLKYGSMSGGIIGLITFFLLGPISAISLGISTLIGSLIPDIDTHSKPSMWTARILTVIIAFTLLQDQIAKYIVDIGYQLNYAFALILALIFTAIKSSKHRGYTHKYTLPCVLGAVAVYFTVPMLFAFSLGLIVHYACDSMKPWNLRNWF